MSNKSNLRFLVVLLFAAFATAALAFGDFGALAQNANGNTTGDASMQNSNSNGGMRRRRRRGRRRARAANANAADANANTGDATMTGGNMNMGGQNDNMGGATTGATGRGRRGRRRRGRRNAAAAAAATGESVGQAQAAAGDVSGTQTDLSGTYAGHARVSGGLDVDGDGTLTITGNQFSLESGGTTHAGRVYAVTTRGYTGAAFYFSDATDSTTNTPAVANVRARKNGDRLSLTPVPGSSTKFWFNAGRGGGGGGRRGGRRGRHSMTMAPPAETTGDASATGDTSAAGTGDANMNATPRRGRRGSRRRRGNATNTNANTNTGDNSNATPPL